MMMMMMNKGRALLVRVQRDGPRPAYGGQSYRQPSLQASFQVYFDKQ